MSKWISLPAGALSLCLLPACADRAAESGPEFEADPAVIKSALHTTVLGCQRERIECRREADDRSARNACDETFADCLREAADEADRVAEALNECRDEARECVRDGDSVRTCRRQYQSCAEAAMEGEPEERDAGAPEHDAGASDEDAGSDEGGNDDDDGEPGDAGVDDADDDSNGRNRDRSSGGLLGVDAGAAIARLPKPLQCSAKLRACIVLDRSAAMACADEARMCLEQ